MTISILFFWIDPTFVIFPHLRATQQLDYFSLYTSHISYHYVIAILHTLTHSQLKSFSYWPSHFQCIFYQLTLYHHHLCWSILLACGCIWVIASGVHVCGNTVLPCKIHTISFVFRLYTLITILKLMNW